VFFGLFHGEKQTGFIALENPEVGRYFLRRLAVLPDYRHGGSGGILLRYCIGYIRERGGGKAVFGMINENTVLKEWYLKMGFREREMRELDTVPVAICVMDLEIGPESTR